MTGKEIRKPQIQQQNGLTPTTPSTTPAVSNPKVDVSVWLKQGTTKDQAKQLGATDEDFNKIDGGDFGGNENGVIDDFEVLLYHADKYKKENKSNYTKEQAEEDGLVDVFNKFNTNVNPDGIDVLDEQERFNILQKAYEERTGKKLTIADITEPTEKEDPFLNMPLPQRKEPTSLNDLDADDPLFNNLSEFVRTQLGVQFDAQNEYLQVYQNRVKQYSAIGDRVSVGLTYEQAVIVKQDDGTEISVANPMKNITLGAYYDVKDTVYGDTKHRNGPITQEEYDAYFLKLEQDYIETTISMSIEESKKSGYLSHVAYSYDPKNPPKVLNKNDEARLKSVLDIQTQITPGMTLEDAKATGDPNIIKTFEAIAKGKTTIERYDITSYQKEQLKTFDIGSVYETIGSMDFKESLKLKQQLLGIYIDKEDAVKYKPELVNLDFNGIVSKLGISPQQLEGKTPEEQGRIIGDAIRNVLQKDISPMIKGSLANTIINELMSKTEFTEEEKAQGLDVLVQQYKNGEGDATKLTNYITKRVVEVYLSVVSNMHQGMAESDDDNSKLAMMSSIYSSLKDFKPLKDMLEATYLGSMMDAKMKARAGNLALSNTNVAEGGLQSLSKSTKIKAVEMADTEGRAAMVRNNTDSVEEVRDFYQTVAATMDSPEQQEELLGVINAINQTMEIINNGGADGQSFSEVFNNTLQTVFPDYVPPTSSSSSSSGSTGGNTAVNGGNNGYGSVTEYYYSNLFNNDLRTQQVAFIRSKAVTNPIAIDNQEQINNELSGYFKYELSCDQNNRYNYPHLIDSHNRGEITKLAKDYNKLSPETQKLVEKYFSDMSGRDLINFMLCSDEGIQKFLFENGIVNFNFIKERIHTSAELNNLYNSLKTNVSDVLTEEAEKSSANGKHLTLFEEMLLEKKRQQEELVKSEN